MKKKCRKKDSGDEVSRLEKQVRELKSINRNLTKRLKKLEKGKDRYEEFEEEAKEEQFAAHKPLKVETCKKCDKGEIEVIDLGIRKIKKCNNCGTRETKKA